jgi:hypothetical protein
VDVAGTAGRGLLHQAPPRRGFAICSTRRAAARCPAWSAPARRSPTPRPSTWSSRSRVVPTHVRCTSPSPNPTVERGRPPRGVKRITRARRSRGARSLLPSPPLPAAPREELPGCLAPMLRSTGSQRRPTADRCRSSSTASAASCAPSPTGGRCAVVPGDRTECFPELAAIPATLGRHRALLDGEVVVFDDLGRRTSRRCAGDSGMAPRGRSVVRDVRAMGPLHLDGRSTRHLPPIRRQRFLTDLLRRAATGGVCGGAATWLARAGSRGPRQHELEG